MPLNVRCIRSSSYRYISQYIYQLAWKDYHTRRKGTIPLPLPPLSPLFGEGPKD